MKERHPLAEMLLPGLEAPTAPQIVNVASVPQRSPFRYPGGKTWLIPRIRDWLVSLPKRPALFVEPFAGGGIVALTVAMEQLAGEVLMVELDSRVAAVWRTIITGDAEWLAEKIETFVFTPDSVLDLLNTKPLTDRELAFQTILRNRVSHGGIMAPGAGIIKTGESGKGLGSRWYPQTLSRRIRRIAHIRDRIRFIEGDGLEIMQQEHARSDAVFFIDPPYSAPGKRAGSRLYTHFQVDHRKLFDQAARLKGDFLMTYDNTASIRRLAEEFAFDLQAIAMKNTHHAEMTELLIGKDLRWARETPLQARAYQAVAA